MLTYCWLSAKPVFFIIIIIIGTICVLGPSREAKIQNQCFIYYITLFPQKERGSGYSSSVRVLHD